VVFTVLRCSFYCIIEAVILNSLTRKQWMFYSLIYQSVFRSMKTTRCLLPSRNKALSFHP
jgi:hypothetical protein